LIVEKTLEVEITEDGLGAFLDLSERRFRPVVIALFRIERWAKSTKTSPITGDHVRRILTGKSGVSKSTFQPARKVA
jgi:hypothetical protein